MYQGIAALLDCFENEHWDRIKLEPQTQNDKVDIMLMKGNVIIKAIQVKSSKNEFYGPSVERWITDLKTDVDASEYELILIGDCASSALKYCNQINRENINTRIVRKEFNEKELLRSVKGSIVEYLKKYHNDKQISPAMIENIEKRLLADLLITSTNEVVYTRDDLQKIISENTIKVQGKGKCKKIISRLTRAICVILWFLISFFSVQYSDVSIVSIVSVILSIVVMLSSWGLMKYSDSCYWNNIGDEKCEVHKTNESCNCPYVIITTIMDRIFWKQEIILKNISKQRIDKIKGKLVFFLHKTREQVDEFCEYDIDAGIEVVIDKISANANSDFFKRTYWDRVELEVLEIILEGKKEENWSGTIIRFSRIPNLEPIRYLRIFGVEILPYEMSWIYNNIIRNVMDYILIFWRGPYGGYNKIDRWFNFKIKTIVFFKNTLCRISVIFILLFIVSLISVTIYGQTIVLKGVLELIMNAVDAIKK